MIPSSSEFYKEVEGMKFLRRIKVAVLIFALTVITWGLLYMTALAVECFWVCPKPYICKLVWV